MRKYNMYRSLVKFFKFLIMLPFLDALSSALTAAGLLFNSQESNVPRTDHVVQEYIATNQNTERIILPYRNLNDTNVLQLCALIRTVDLLISIDLNHNHIEETGFTYLYKSLKETERHVNTLEVVNLSYNYIGASVFSQMIDLLISFPHLRINMDYNPLSAICFRGITALNDYNLAPRLYQERGITRDFIIQNGHHYEFLHSPSSQSVEFMTGLIKNGAIHFTYATTAFNPPTDTKRFVLFLRGLRYNSVIQVLNLNNCKIAGNVTLLADALRHNRTLCSINLLNNDIDDDGITVLGAILPDNNTLRHLGLSANKISSCGIGNFARGLSQSTSLEWLDLSFNKFGSAGARRIAKALDVHTLCTLRYLNLSGTSIKDDILRREIAAGIFEENVEDELDFMALIARNHHLQYLDLSLNDLTEKSAEQFCTNLATINALRSQSLQINLALNNIAMTPLLVERRTEHCNLDCNYLEKYSLQIGGLYNYNVYRSAMFRFRESLPPYLHKYFTPKACEIAYKFNTSHVSFLELIKSNDEKASSNHCGILFSQAENGEMRVDTYHLPPFIASEIQSLATTLGPISNYYQIKTWSMETVRDYIRYVERAEVKAAPLAYDAEVPPLAFVAGIREGFKNTYIALLSRKEAAITELVLASGRVIESIPGIETNAAYLQEFLENDTYQFLSSLQR